MEMGLAELYLFFHVIVSFSLLSGAAKQKVDFQKHTPQFFVEKKLLDNYTKQDPPDPKNSTVVQLGIYVNSFYSISEQNMDYAVNLYLRQSWLDPRLKFKSPDGKLHQMKMGDNYWNNIWVPDVFFRNEKKADYHTVTVPNRLLRINSTGHLWYVLKITATLSCPMDLRRYPLDAQTCPMMFESFGYTTQTMQFTWLDEPVAIDPELQLPQFSVDVPQLIDCTQSYPAGNFTCLQINFILKRDIGFFIIQVYVPSILIVILSWVSFWINIDASPARVSLGLLTVLTTTTMSGSARESLPRVSYIKAIDVWMIVCLTFVFASLIEYAVVNVIARRRIKPGSFFPGSVFRSRAAIESSASTGVGARRRFDSGSPFPMSQIRPERMEQNFKAPDPDASKKRARSVDKFSRKCFPAVFIIFNVVYWLVYTVFYLE